MDVSRLNDLSSLTSPSHAAHKRRAPEMESKRSGTQAGTMSPVPKPGDKMPVVVLSCKECRNIITDNTCLQYDCAETLIFSSVCKVVQGKTLHHSDMGSFLELACECGLPMGRVYHSTTQQWDHIRNLYCLTAQALQRYHVGQPQNGTENDLGAPALKPPQQMMFLIIALENSLKKVTEEHDILAQRVKDLESVQLVPSERSKRSTLEREHSSENSRKPK